MICSLSLYFIPHIYDSVLKNDCSSKGGDWNLWGFPPQGYRCEIPARDAGKVCTEGSQCSYSICTGGLLNQTPRSTGSCIKYKEDSSLYIKAT